MKIGSGIYIGKRITALQFNIEFSVAGEYFFFNRSCINAKKEKEGIKYHKRNVWDMCSKNADCKHIFLLFS
ncbi:MAG TPA: hypothetical protein P5210_03950 [Draconibacterium sp.]|nr:hypothetical protein [Draconibacterium sp.]HRX10778.1 hypothetical protein [Draconibacterium sp.]